MSRIGAILYSLAILGVIIIFAPVSFPPARVLLVSNSDHHTNNAFFGVVGLLASTVGPTSLSIFVWVISKRPVSSWIAHIIFIPIAIAIFSGGASLFFYGAAALGDNSPEIYSLFLAGALLSLTTIVHVVALFTEAYKKIAYRKKRVRD